MAMTRPERERAADLLRARITRIREFVAVHCPEVILTVASGKGGIGKSTIARELAWVWNAIACDLDWDGGMITRLFGHDPEATATAPLLDALETGKPPRLVKLTRRPDLIPGHPDLADNQPSAEVMKEALIAWNKHYKRPLCVDTHPGGGDEVTRGAIAAADRVIMPVELGTAELNALEQDLIGYDGYPLLLVLNKQKRAFSEPHLKRFMWLAETVGARVAATAIGHHPWLQIRRATTMVTATVSAMPERSIEFATNIVDLAEEVAKNVAA